MTRLALLLVLIAACSKDDPYFCEADCEMMIDGGGSGSNACTGNADCSGGTPVCDMTAGSCVACTASDIGACDGTTPICVAAMNMCAPCVAHDECTASNACLPSGACGTDAEVAYVASTGNDGNPCTHAQPCATLTKAATVKPFVKLENDIVETVTFANVANVTVLAAPGTQISRLTGNDNAVVTVSGTSNVTLKNVVIRGGATSTGHGILVGAGANGVTLKLEDVAVVNNAGNGLSIGGGMLTLTRVLVARNDSGGAIIAGDFDITSSMFVSNGTSGAPVGGVQLAPGATKHVFAFNTVADNSSTNMIGRGVNCVYPMTLTSTLIVNNLPNGCTFEYSMSDMDLGGTTNKTGSAQFKNTLANMPLAPDFYRIDGTSDAIDSGAPSSTVMTDIDGDSRPQGNARDIGADEYK